MKISVDYQSCWAVNIYRQAVHPHVNAVSVLGHRVLYVIHLCLCSSHLTQTCPSVCVRIPISSKHTNKQIDNTRLLFCLGRILSKQIFILSYSAVIHKGIHDMLCLVAASLLRDNCTLDRLEHRVQGRDLILKFKKHGMGRI